MLKALYILYLVGAVAQSTSGQQLNGNTLGNQINTINNQLETRLKTRAADVHETVISEGAVAFMFAENTASRLNLSDPIDATISMVLKKDGPDLRPSRDYRDGKEMTEAVAIRAWTLFREHALVAAQERVKVMRPIIAGILRDSNVTSKCSNSVDSVFDGALRMESWAISMVTSWGNFPSSGLFDGTFSDIGSYETCVNVPKNKYVGHAHYCTLTYRPFLPGRKDYELVVTPEPDSLRKLFTKNHTDTRDKNSNTKEVGNGEELLADAFEDLVKRAQYYHYLYYKLGTCWPIDCSPIDIKQVMKLIGRRNLLINGPVKCYSHYKDDYENMTYKRISTLSNGSETVEEKKLIVSIWDHNDGIYIWKPFFERTHQVALIVIITVTVFILFMTSLDILLNRIPQLISFYNFAMQGLKLDELGDQISSIRDARDTTNGSPCRSGKVEFAMVGQEVTEQVDTARIQPVIRLMAGKQRQEKSFFMTLVDDCSVITNTAQFFRISEGQLRNDILCLNGVRCITMVWILMTHTMLYHDWSAFGRTRQVESALHSPLTQPLFNGSYLVDTFFLMSGLLSAYTAFKHSQGISKKFNSIAFILSRWLRLTPQILFASLIYILIPSLSSGPHWWPITGEFSENCVANWWINVLHLQAFYKTDRMCNFVTWWISIDYFYHFLALAAIWIILWLGHKSGFIYMAVLLISGLIMQGLKHYSNKLPPNIFSTIPQTGAMWSTMTLDFYWTPYAHGIPFFFGFYIGYLMALKKKIIYRWLNTKRALIGWVVSGVLFFGQGFAPYWWNLGKASYSPWASTTFNIVCPIIWSGSLCWTVIACQHGYGGFINDFLSLRVFTILGKASYFVYLTHFQILFLYFGNHHVLMEPTPFVMSYVVIGNILLSTLYGVFLCIVYELPWLKQQKKLMKFV